MSGHTLIENKDLIDVKTFTMEDYCPDKSTALYHAIVSTIDWFRYESNVLLVMV